MELKVQSIHFDATEKLHEFIEKKVVKLEKNSDDVRTAEIILKVVKPEVAMNKHTSIRIKVTSGELFAEKICDTFEEGVDTCIDALLKQLSKHKEKQRGR